MWNGLVAEFVQLQQGWLCDVRPGVFVEEDGSFHIDQSRAQMPEVLLYYINLLAELFLRNRLARIQKVVMSNTSYRPRNSRHNLLLMKCWVWKLLWSLVAVQLLSPKSSTTVEGSFCSTIYNSIKESVVIVAQMKRRRYLKTAFFLILA